MNRIVSTVTAAALLIAATLPAGAGDHRGGSWSWNGHEWVWWSAPPALSAGPALAKPWAYRSDGYYQPVAPGYRGPRWCPNGYGGSFQC